ncbi:MAG TPA: hypothetical protein VKV96_09645 [Roseiarcus sp.]|nr:hypothetical protein [Roseiarcus sp.]
MSVFNLDRMRRYGAGVEVVRTADKVCGTNSLRARFWNFVAIVSERSARRYLEPPLPALHFARAIALRIPIAAAMLVLPCLSDAQESVFANLQGSWAGEGTITSSDGHAERLRCRTKYILSPSGQNLDQQLRCASDSYRFDVNSGLVQQGNGTIAGTWTETTRHVTGNVSAQETGDSIAVKISGPSFAAQMAITLKDDHQHIEIAPNSGDIKSVTIDLTRS